MCNLVDALNKLKKSAPEAIDNECNFSSYNQYMHIQRTVELELIEEIMKAKNVSKKLILVCGNVGDGKSHLISYLFHEKRIIGNDFTIHNDATESFSPLMDDKETLASVLSPFSDENWNNMDESRIIVAINLGVLNNFIDSEYNNNFQKFSSYVRKHGILDASRQNEISSNENSLMTHINFGDYHIYHLNKGKVEAPYITELFEKIVFTSEKNPFYVEYKKCAECELFSCCPVKHNYENFMIPQIRQNIVNVLLEVIIKDKTIISTRDLLNFIYDIIVHSSFTKGRFEKSLGQGYIKKYIDATMPMLLYSNNTNSKILKFIYKHNPLNCISEKKDDLLSSFYADDHIQEFIEKNLMKNPTNHYIIQQEDWGKEKAPMLLYIAYSSKTFGNELIESFNPEFYEYIDYLYKSNRNDYKNMQKLYKLVEECIYKWSGSEKPEFYIETNSDYDIGTKLEIEYDLLISSGGLLEANENMKLFKPFIHIGMRASDKSKEFGKVMIDIDYQLYAMLLAVQKGYRPSTQDSNVFAGFVSFIEQISRFNKMQEEIYLHQNNSADLAIYHLSKTNLDIILR